jgi:hypothetical protein
MAVKSLLDNVVWRALSDRRSVFRGRLRRRYAPGFADRWIRRPGSPDFTALVPYCGRRAFYCDSGAGPADSAWQIDAESTMAKWWEGRTAGR